MGKCTLIVRPHASSGCEGQNIFLLPPHAPVRFLYRIVISVDFVDIFSTLLTTTGAAWNVLVSMAIFYLFSRISTLPGVSFIIGVTAREKLGDKISKIVGHDAAVMSHSFSSAHSVAAENDSSCYF